MFKTLRGRLLISYFAVITLVLLVIGLALLIISAQPAVRYSPVLQQLNTVSQSQRQVLQNLRETGLRPGALEESLVQLAEDSGYRIVLANPGSDRVIYDSAGEWDGQSISAIEPISRRLLPATAVNTVFGRFQSADGARWLAYSPSTLLGTNNRLRLYYVQPEPTAVSFFRQTFFRPLIGAGLLAFLVAILFAFVIAGSVARPLQKMADAAEAIAQGDYDQQLPPQGPEEVQRVAASFNSMATQVKLSRQAQQDFVANVSHDLKTPITSIRGWSQALLDGTAVSPAEQQQAASIINKEADRMARMVSQLLDLARIESGQLELARDPVDLAQVLVDVQQNLRLRTEEQQIHLTLETVPVPSVLGDHDRLVQVFSNLVDNALAHTPAGGRIHLQVRPHGEKAVEGIVQDTGTGIAPEDLSRIFERFYQVDKARSSERRGSGLGLAIVQELVAAHNGRVLARSQVGEGTIFIVRLPTTDVPEASTFVRRSQ
ncbi:MAG: HAMP domain-containing protein [Ardenticatenaceae bacterium]|nr:HAMP domain-containing protein [Ardenticatenaceae bacterium]MCB9442856.1 HAMP domain-containing protein [Ardenticatenaceae bacterium]